jgi:hypothetical protein
MVAPQITRLAIRFGYGMVALSGGRRMWIPVIILALLAVATIAGFLHLQRRAEARAERAQAWPITEGRILQSMLLKTAGRFAPVITYAYVVEGREYRRSRVRFGNYANLSREAAGDIVNRYPEGAAVPVRYDPDRPNLAVLETGPATRTFKFTAWALGGPLLLLAIIFAILAAMASARG